MAANSLAFILPLRDQSLSGVVAISSETSLEKVSRSKAHILSLLSKGLNLSYLVSRHIFFHLGKS
jgi:hypothetical protein